MRFGKYGEMSANHLKYKKALEAKLDSEGFTRYSTHLPYTTSGLRKSTTDGLSAVSITWDMVKVLNDTGLIQWDMNFIYVSFDLSKHEISQHVEKDMYKTIVIEFHRANDIDGYIDFKGDDVVEFMITIPYRSIPEINGWANYKPDEWASRMLQAMENMADSFLEDKFIPFLDEYVLQQEGE